VTSPVDPVLVVGTTSDYVERIAGKLPDRSIFLSDIDIYKETGPPAVQRETQIFASLRDPEESFSRLKKFIDERGIRPGGVACFDCESLLLASDMARRLSLPFPSKQAVMNSRDKLVSKRLWQDAGIGCPRAAMARDEEELRAFIGDVSNPVVLKPATLSGSELTFVCDTPDEAVKAFHVIRDGLHRRMLDRTLNRDRMVDEHAVLCEEFIDGDEYSCDFIVDETGTKIIRTARKYMMGGGPAGTTQAYEVPGMPREMVETIDLAGLLSRASKALGMERCQGMADFIMRGGEPYFLEITPRPGGDCLPQVIEQSCGMDMLEAHIDFSAGRTPRIPPESEWKRTVGLRIHARRGGRLAAIRLWADRVRQEILETGWYREPGDRIGLPPEDYKTWVMGYVIFRPLPGVDVQGQIKDMMAAVEVRIE
jgi:biotin carboxylase